MVILIDNGHGVSTPGKRSPDGRFREYAYARKVAREVVARLKALGHDARLPVPEEADISLGERANRVNAICDQYGKDRVMLVSIHNNALGMGGEWNNATGWEAWTTKGVTKADTLAECLYDAAERVLGGILGKDGSTLKIRTDMSDGDRDKEENWTILYRSKCPAVLTENFFMTNRADVEWLESAAGFDAIVRLHVEGIEAYRQSHCNDSADSQGRLVGESPGVEAISADRSRRQARFSECGLTGAGHIDNPGPRGRSGCGPLQPIAESLLQAARQTATLLRTGSPQTTSGPQGRATSGRQSDGGSTRGQTGISIDTNGCLTWTEE